MVLFRQLLNQANLSSHDSQVFAIMPWVLYSLESSCAGALVVVLVCASILGNVTFAFDVDIHIAKTQYVINMVVICYHNRLCLCHNPNE